MRLETSLRGDQAQEGSVLPSSLEVGHTLTHAAGHRVVPLGQCIGHCPAADGCGALQQVAGVALKADDGACGELGADSPAIPGLGDRAALRVTGAWHSCRQDTGQRTWKFEYRQDKGQGHGNHHGWDMGQRTWSLIMDRTQDRSRQDTGPPSEQAARMGAGL